MVLRIMREDEAAVTDTDRSDMAAGPERRRAPLLLPPVMAGEPRAPGLAAGRHLSGAGKDRGEARRV